MEGCISVRPASSAFLRLFVIMKGRLSGLHSRGIPDLRRRYLAQPDRGGNHHVRYEVGQVLGAEG